MAVLLARHAIFLAPLNVDEELTLRLSEFSFRNIFHIVSTQRGGGPLHFWLEHFLLGWWPSLQALRVPSLVFFCLALPAVALVARELIGAEAAAGVVLLTAASPVPESYATFGRPHTMLFAWLMWGTVLALRAARTGGRGWWIAAGAELGTSVFVHPTAPLYALVAFAAALLYAPRRWRAVAGEAWPGAVALVVGFLPYYIATLHVLGDRYGIGAGAPSGRTFSGNPVWEDALHFVAPGAHDLNYFSLLAIAGLVVLAATRRRVAIFAVVTVAAPVLFFTYVPASGTSALFFDRYMIPVAPAFLVLVLAGCLTVARWAGAWRLLVLAILVAGLLTIEIRIDVPRQHVLRALDLTTVTHAVAAADSDAVLFGTTGASNTGTFAGAFTFGRPATILDRYLSLRIGGLRVVDDDACARLAPFLLGPQTAVHGLWVFYAAYPDEQAAGSSAFDGVNDVTVERPATGYLLVRSQQALPPRRLVELGQLLRQNSRVNELLIADRQALRNPYACPAYGDLGDPDISPHWPPIPSKS
jgi:Dolichyl-phosphate-mannose-protein mannosyltransferase